jgi:hypothetical protein
LKENLGNIAHAYKRAFVLSAIFCLDFLRIIRTSKQELLWIRLCNAFLLFFPIILWFRALFTFNWLLLFPLSLAVLVLLLSFLLTSDEPEIYKSETELQQYAQSEQWLVLREQAFKRDNCCCAVCKGKQNLKIERLTDRHLGNERLHELITICEECYHLPAKRLKK